MNTPLNNEKLKLYFPFNDGVYTIYLQLWDNSFLTVELNGVISIGGKRLCPIRCAEDLAAFVKGLQAKVMNAAGEVNIYDLSDKLVECQFLEEIKLITGVDPSLNTRYRKREYVTARHLHMMVLNIAFNMSLHVAAGTYNMGHTMALHAIKKINNWRDTDKAFRDKTQKLMEMIEVRAAMNKK
jgi:hypothetical protein